jgi:outer membrane protein OmpA-like peptidoglycan-associated protein
LRGIAFALFVLIAAASAVQAQVGVEGRPWLEEDVQDRPWVGGEPPPPPDREYREDYPERRPPPPPPYGEYRDYEGYPDRQPPPPRAESGWQGNVLFDLDSARLRSEHEPFLDSIYRAMRANPDIDLLITGHADHIGDLDYNRRLARRRAESVERYLVNRGVDPNRIVTRTVGEQRPIASSETEEDRRRNRRADLAFFPAGSEPPPAGEMVIGDTEPGRGPPPGPTYRRLPE